MASVKIYYLIILGFGVFTTKVIGKCDFICEYHGDFITPEEGNKILEESSGSFVYFYALNGKEYW